MPLWLYFRQGQTRGPLSEQDLVALIRSGQLGPDDLVSQAGTNAWVPARTVPTLFPSSPEPTPEPGHTPSPATTPSVASPAPNTTPGPAPQPATVSVPENARSSLLRTLLGMPKPLLFGLFGGLGGLLGALLVGEFLWQVVSPSELKPRMEVQAAVPDAVTLHAGGKNRFFVKIARQGFSGPVRVGVTAESTAIQAPGIDISPTADEGEVTVEVAPGLSPGRYPLTVRLEGPEGQAITPARQATVLVVKPAPPALAVAASPEVIVEQGRSGRFSVRINRVRFSGPVTIDFAGAPVTVALPTVIIPAEKDVATVDFNVAAECPEIARTVAVQASGQHEGLTVFGTSDFRLAVEKRRPPTVDVVFVLDLTSSMDFAIAGIKRGVQKFARELEGKNLDVRLGLIGFRDIEEDRQRPFSLKFGDDSFTRDYPAFRDAVGRLNADGGGDDPESSLQALALAADQPFRSRAARVLVLITDVHPKIHRRETPSTVSETVEVLRRRAIDQVHLLVTREDASGAYNPFRTAFKGSSLDLATAARGTGFDALLDALSADVSRIAIATPPLSAGSASEPPPPPVARSTEIAPPVEVPVLQAVQSTQVYAAKDLSWLLLALTLWTMVVGGAISVFLLGGQEFHARQAFAPLGASARALAGGLLAGLVGGVVGQLVFQTTTGGSLWEGIARLLGWTCLGGLLGIVVAFAVPNLKWVHGMAGGLLGGLLGAVGFLTVGALLGSLPGRWLGAGILGFCLGLMVALADLVFRRYWLEIAVGPREVRTVTLGSTPVSLGSDELRASFFVSGVAPLALRYWIEGESVRCEDVVTGEIRDIEPGQPQTHGKFTVTARSAATAAQTGFTLDLSDGRAVRLREGLPLTAEDLPGLTASGNDGMVALVSRVPNRPGVIVLRNRSAQTWSVRTREGVEQTVEPGRAVDLNSGVRIRFGTAEGLLRPDR